MKFIYLLLFLTLLIGCAQKIQYSTISSEEAQDLNAIILDIRTPIEYDSGHIKDAILINYYEENFRDNLNKLDKNEKYFIYCRSGHRSKDTLIIMQELNFTNVYNLQKGIIEWKMRGYPIENNLNF